jgi:polyhydroxyalkanoate synthesis regulator phasin
MSIPPPDRPTERLQPQPPERLVPQPPPPPVYEERVVSPAVDTHAVLLRLEDAVQSLRTGLMIVGVISVAALGVAIYALMKDDGGTGSRAGLATDSRVSQLDDRIDRLSRQVQDARSDAAKAGDAAGVEGRVAALEKTVKTLADRPAPGDATQAVNELSDRIDDVTADVEQLKSAQTTP